MGGVKGSAFGRLQGREGLGAGTNVEAVFEDGLQMHRAIELFPGRHHDYDVTREGVRLLYARGLGGKVDALIGLGKALRKRAFS